ncbi:DUF6415 family natural product biosynthesis protein [Streptomyces sp. NPDC051907]|uniref:DUF6415 family natural product biosynthesis protein n=1 Tax=Streptomyces sp. NPDC051907 TaxID=3155284 RepID=UPI003437F810
MNDETSRERSPLATAPVGFDKASILSSAESVLEGTAVETAEELVLLLRVHIGLLAPQIEELALSLPGGEQGRCLALASVGEARRKLRAGQAAGAGPQRRAEQLARVCRALIFHWEELQAARLRAEGE